VDSLFSMIRSHNPDIVIVRNGIERPGTGDWDVLIVEGWGSYSGIESAWEQWPSERMLLISPEVANWPKKHALEIWCLVGGIGDILTKCDDLDKWWQEQLRLQISLIGDGIIANMDHSSSLTVEEGFDKENSPRIQLHKRMADWTDPGNIPPLYESYTNVNPGPLKESDWGYNTINLTRDAIYLHMLVNPKGKKGMPQEETITISPVGEKAEAVIWMNKNKPLSFKQNASELAIDIGKVEADIVDTIIKIVLSNPLPRTPNKMLMPKENPLKKDPQPGNLARGKPAKLLDPDGKTELVPSGLANYAFRGLDDSIVTVAQGGGSYPWIFHVDLETEHVISKVIIRFGEKIYATEYHLLFSVDGENWQTVAKVDNAKGGSRTHQFERTPVRYVRVEGLKPDGPGQEGSQMSIAELEVYE